MSDQVLPSVPLAEKVNPGLKSARRDGRSPYEYEQRLARCLS